jgi:WD40 repeat protein
VFQLHLALSPDGRTLAVGDTSGAVLLIDATDGHVRHRLEAADEGGRFVGALAFSPDGRELAVGSREQVRIWSLAGSTPVPLVRLAGHHDMVAALAYDASGRHLASGGQDRTVRVWDLGQLRDEFARLRLD